SRFVEMRPKRRFRSAERKDRTRTLIEANEHLRKHIARELHDDIGQRLSLLSIRLGLLQQLQAIKDPGGNLVEFLRDLDTLISDVHHLSHNLHSSRIEHLGLESGLQEIVSNLSKTCNIRIDLDAKNILRDLPSGFALCFLRIAQESLNNAIKH